MSTPGIRKMGVKMTTAASFMSMDTVMSMRFDSPSEIAPSTENSIRFYELVLNDCKKRTGSDVLGTPGNDTRHNLISRTISD